MITFRSILAPLNYDLNMKNKQDITEVSILHVVMVFDYSNQFNIKTIKSPRDGADSRRPSQATNPVTCDLGSGQGHINTHNKYRTTSIPDRVPQAIWKYMAL